jgi:NAD(P)-dependent dehydrogenase (short-subunit alcohol dehydrogenase family)
MARLEGKVAIITGGGSGLGRAMAQRFVAEGASVLVADVNDAGGQETLDAIGDAERTAFQHVDVTNEDDCERAAAEAVKRWGKLDIMVANAGIGAPGTIATLDKAAWDAVIAVNLTGVFLCAKHAFRAMRDHGGVILGTASVAGLEATPALGPYGASKAGVVQLMGTVALEGARYGIRANALCPAWTQTPLVDAFVSGARASEEEARARLISGIPLGRLGDPADVASAAVYLASDEASFITGVAFRIDGGHLAGR